MLKDLKRLGRETLVYGLSTIVGRTLNILLLPLYTNYLVPAEFGVVATTFAYLAFFNVVYGYGMDLAYMRHTKAEPTADSHRDFSTAFLSVALTSCALSGLICLAAPALASAAGIPAGLTGIVRYSAFILAMDAVALVPFAHLRLRQKAWAYALIKTANIIVNVAATWYFLARLHLGVEGVFAAAAAASAAALLLLLPVIERNLRPVFDRRLYLSLIKFGLPLVPAGLASMMVQVIDRPILQAMTDNETVGIYAANYRLGIFMQLVINMFDQAWRPFILPRAEDPGAKPLIARVLTYFVLVGTMAVLGVALLIGDIVRIPLPGGKTLVHPAYWSGLSIVPVVLLGYLFNGLYYNFLAPVNLAKRNDLVAYVTALGAAVNVAVNLALIPTMTIMGAALATLVAYAAMAVAMYYLAQRVHPVEYEYRRLGHVAVVFALLWAGAAWLGRSLAGDCLRIPVELAAVLALPALLVATGFLEEDERAALRRLFRLA